MSMHVSRTRYVVLYRTVPDWPDLRRLERWGRDQGAPMRKFLLSAGMLFITVLASALPSKADSVADFSVASLGLTFSLPDTFTPASITGSSAVVNNIPGTLLGGSLSFGAVTLGTSGTM